MKVFCLCNNRLGREVVRYLRAQGDEIVGVAVHPRERSRMRDEIIEAAGVTPDRVFEPAALTDPAALQQIRDLQPEMGVSVMFGYILRPPLLALFPREVVNLHPSYLPYNRGAFPNVWSIVDKTPAGATLHYVDAGVDTGDLIAQWRVEVSPADDGASLYYKLEEAAAALFRQAWPRLRAGTAPRSPQPVGATTHRTADVARIDHIDLDKVYRAGDLIDILRARSFPPYRGAYFESNGQRVYLRLELSGDDPSWPASAPTPEGEAKEN